jgi:LmbE family N-acetylglucosaminyl deacetylase
VTTIDLPTPRQVLAIGAHPDDVEFGCGASLARWSATGCAVHLAVLTDGSKGSWDPTIDTVQLVATRRREQDDAAAVLGGAQVHWFAERDGELEPHPRIVEAVAGLLRSVRPDVVLAHDPWRAHRLHPDHHAAGRVVVEAVVAARDPHFLPDHALPPHRPARLALFDTDTVDHLERVDGFVAAKIDALLCHRSQWRSTMGIADDPDVEAARFARQVRVEAAAAGARRGLAAAEAFKLLTP